MEEVIVQHPDFHIHKFYAYTGPNYYLDRQAMVFNLYLDPDGAGVEFYKNQVLEKFPELENDFPTRLVELFAKVLSVVFKMDMNLFVRRYDISRDGEEWVIALEHLDDYLAKEAIYFVSDWFVAMTQANDEFDFTGEFERLQEIFNSTIFGGPTIYSLIEGGIKRKINVHYLYEENQFQWGYGKKQIRGRSTIFHIDGIKDTEFTSYKDMVGEFLEMCNFPTPSGKNCFEEEEIVAEALKLGFPVVVKPVAGHKGQGVTTGIESEEEVKKAFNNIIKAAENEGVAFEGALVQQQIYGYDHRILTIGGKYAAALKRIPAYVMGDGTSTIAELIEIENSREIRIDNARSPLAKIVLDDDMKDFLTLQEKTAETVPAAGEEVVLRRVANISAGGVSINVTNDIHPDNIRMVENIAKFLQVTVLGIDVLAADIAKPWTEGNFGIIEINAGPGVFMHLAPAEGGTVDIPGKIMEHLFGKFEGFDRIPIITGNKLTDKLITKINNKFRQYKENAELGSLRETGVYFNEHFFTNNERHDENCKILLRNPKLDCAIINHTRNDIHDYGMWHQGSDVVILEHANFAERVQKRDLLPGGILIEIRDVEVSDIETIANLKREIAQLKRQLNSEEITEMPSEELSQEEPAAETEKETKTILTLTVNDDELERITINDGDNLDELIFEVLKPYLKEILFKYDYYLKLQNKPENLSIDNQFVK